MNSQSIAQNVSNFATQSSHAAQSAQSGAEPLTQQVISAGQTLPSASQSVVDAAQSAAIGQGPATQLLEQLEAISQSAAMGATQAIQYLQGVLY